MLIAALTVTLILIVTSTFCVLVYRNRQKNDTEKNIYVPYIEIKKTIKFSGVFCVLMLILVWFEQVMGYALMMMLIFFCGMMIESTIFSIKPFMGGFEARGYLGRKFLFSFAELNDLHTRRILLDYLRRHSRLICSSEEGKEFLESLNNIYKLYTGNDIPKFYGGYMWASYASANTPNNVVTSNTLMAVAVVLVLMTAMMISIPVVFPWECKNVSTEFVYWIFDDGCYILYSDEFEERFKIENYRSYDVIASKPDSFCDGETYELVVDKENDFMIVISMTGEDGTEYVTKEQSHENHWNDENIAILLASLSPLVIAAYCIGGFFVFREPRKYNNFVRSLYPASKRS